MERALVSLLASSLPATFFFFALGAIFLKKLRLTFGALAFGFVVAWLIAAVTALVIADHPNINSATQEMIPAALIGTFLSLTGIGIAGKRKNGEK